MGAEIGGGDRTPVLFDTLRAQARGVRDDVGVEEILRAAVPILDDPGDQPRLLGLGERGSRAARGRGVRLQKRLHHVPLRPGGVVRSQDGACGQRDRTLDHRDQPRRRLDGAMGEELYRVVAVVRVVVRLPVIVEPPTRHHHPVHDRQQFSRVILARSALHVEPVTQIGDTRRSTFNQLSELVGIQTLKPSSRSR